MLTTDRAAHFAGEWIEAWNSHDRSVRGKPALRAYWQRGLAANPGLRFELDRVLVGTDSLVIAYRNHRGQHCGEWLRLDDADRAVAGAAHYG